MTPTDTVVSEERLRETLLDASARTTSWLANSHWTPRRAHLESLRNLVAQAADALSRRAATPQSGGVRLTAYEMQVLIGTSMSGCAMQPDTTFNVQNAWKRLHDLGLIDRADGLAIATTSGRDRIRSTLADPIPEAPADEEVEGVAKLEADSLDAIMEVVGEGAEFAAYNRGKSAMRDWFLAALRRSTETDKPGVREAALEEAANAVPGWRDPAPRSLDDERGPNNATFDAGWNECREKAIRRIRALSAPLAEEQPVPSVMPRLETVRAHKHTCANVQPGSTYADKCDCGALDTAGQALPRSTTGGAE